MAGPTRWIAALVMLVGAVAPAGLVAPQSALAAPPDQTYPSFNSASAVVLGRAPMGFEVAKWLVQMKGSYGMAAAAEDGVSFVEAVAFLKAFLANPVNGTQRAQTIDRAFLWVYGIPSTPVQQAKWDADLRAGKAWYATMVGPLTQEITADTGTHKVIIGLAFQKSFGRGPTMPEQMAELSRSRGVGLIVQEKRSFLYSAVGASELSDTVARSQNYKSAPQDSATIKMLLPKFAATKAIYAEMIAQ